MKAIAGKENGEANGRIARGRAVERFITPDIKRFHPGQRHGDAEAAQERAPRKIVSGHDLFEVGGVGDIELSINDNGAWARRESGIKAAIRFMTGGCRRR